MFRLNVRKFFSIALWCSVVLVGFGQAQGQTIERQMVFRDIYPNTPIERTVSAVTPVFSAQCSAAIPTGELIMSINGHSKSITPTQQFMSLVDVAGIPTEGGKNSYKYTIVWKSSSPSN